MTALHALAPGLTPGVEHVDTPESMAVIHRPGCAAAIWDRQMMPAFQTWIDALDPETLPSARIVLRPDRIRSALRTVCDIAGTPEGNNRRALIDDAAALADLFAGIMQAPYLRVRFDVVRGNACRRFHLDAVTARMVCTYRGPGTQYGTARDGADPDPVHSVPARSPIILRGSLWPEAPDAALRHRSPPIEGTGETRLLYVLDPVYDIEDEI